MTSIKRTTLLLSLIYSYQIHRTTEWPLPRTQDSQVWPWSCHY